MGTPTPTTAAAPAAAATPLASAAASIPKQVAPAPVAQAAAPTPAPVAAAPAPVQAAPTIAAQAAAATGQPTTQQTNVGLGGPAASIASGNAVPTGGGGTAPAQPYQRPIAYGAYPEATGKLSQSGASIPQFSKNPMAAGGRASAVNDAQIRAGLERIAKAYGGPNIHVKKVHAPEVKKPEMTHTGPIHSSVAGRTDHLPMQVPEGSYVLPADHVSGLGEGNSAAGYKVLSRMFGGNPYQKGPIPYAGKGGPYNSGAHPYNQASPLPYGAHMKDGGAVGTVPIVAAGGEHVLSPEQVREIGAGDLDRGHRVLDKWVLKMRKELIKTLKHLDPPKRD